MVRMSARILFFGMEVNSDAENNINCGYDFYLEDDLFVVECSPAAKIRCVCDNHRFRNIYPGGDKNQPGTITRGEFEYDNEPYVRISVIDRSGKIAWTNPIFLEAE